ncbi:RNA polymerase sigma factor [Promicromonospora iranensis]|uniref:RNA polymerase sigma-70 factor (ECF subfamily) n=1 Tax=Promicromonospora iranensis TaxID=1105144 RepID=A0ABU2CT40_9MICO|nr:RNA polymerase sigma factor [Promicromonospora iranensis]MDR7384513.1 RNA polymerase sigma-70 factor (ECF subfamily) [Promicromonospora iranensis]
MSDELLVVRAQLGNRAALEDLVTRWQRPVWLYVRRMLDAERADDVAQEAWIAVVRALPRLREPDRFAPWLFTIVRRATLNRMRRQYADRHDLVGDFESDVDRPHDGIRDPVDGLMDRAEMVARLAGIPVLEREVLVLHYLEDLSVEDCAQVCGVPAGTVKSRLNRARLMLRAHVEEEGERT